MILLDTNVLSALMRVPSDAVVQEWLDRQDPARLWTTSVTVFETRSGLARMSEGHKRATLEKAFEEVLRHDLSGRVAPLDRAAAEAAGLLAARRAAAGRPGDMRDTMIAGIALARRAVVATRNVRHYGDLETGIVNPWATRAGTP